MFENYKYTETVTREISVEDIYRKGVVIPEGCRAIAFRVPRLGDLVLAWNPFFTFEMVSNTKFPKNEPRIILEKVRTIPGMPQKEADKFFEKWDKFPASKFYEPVEYCKVGYGDLFANPNYPDVQLCILPIMSSIEWVKLREKTDIITVSSGK